MTRPIIVTPEYLRLLAEGMELTRTKDWAFEDFGDFIYWIRVLNSGNKEFLLRFNTCETNLVMERETR